MLEYGRTRGKYNNKTGAHDDQFPQCRPGGHPNKGIPDARHQPDLTIRWWGKTLTLDSIQHGTASFIAGRVASTSSYLTVLSFCISYVFFWAPNTPPGPIGSAINPTRPFAGGVKRSPWTQDRKSTRLNSSHVLRSRMPSSA